MGGEEETGWVKKKRGRLKKWKKKDGGTVLKKRMGGTGWTYKRWKRQLSR